MSRAGAPKARAAKKHASEVSAAHTDFEKAILPAKMMYLESIRTHAQRRDQRIEKANVALHATGEKRRERDKRKAAARA